MSNEQANKLRTWIEPKKVEIHTLKQKMEFAELRLKHNKENIKDGWFIKQQKKKIKEQQSDYERKLEEFELEKLESDIEKGFLTRPTEMAIEELKMQLQMAEKSLEEINKAIVKAGRNHKVEIKPIDSEEGISQRDEAREEIVKEEKETNAGGTPEDPTYEKNGYGRLPPEEKKDE